MNQRFKGKHHSDESKHKISIAKKGKPTWASTHKTDMSEKRLGVNNPLFGKRHSEQSKLQMSASAKGRTFSEDTKRKLRIAAINQHRKNGTDFPAVDAGARECFQYLNMYYDLHIQYPNIELKELGYFVDGYDPITHSIYEYDNKGHNSTRQSNKDKIRQAEIIEYYKSIRKPLSSFYRVNATGVGAFEMKDVLTIK